ncbi:hypothetical protein BKA70DRAFT_1199537 [Coprinopsis sp. MPI-PUGE-AT-0042]|nr:hypothetical protein BKA70DRAFT_1199537 [Coprinopsis sp. MPI-PUGE-AT-0042]
MARHGKARRSGARWILLVSTSRLQVPLKAWMGFELVYRESSRCLGDLEPARSRLVRIWRKNFQHGAPNREHEGASSSGSPMELLHGMLSSAWAQTLKDQAVVEEVFDCLIAQVEKLKRVEGTWISKEQKRGHGAH